MGAVEGQALAHRAHTCAHASDGRRMPRLRLWAPTARLAVLSGARLRKEATAAAKRLMWARERRSRELPPPLGVDPVEECDDLLSIPTNQRTLTVTV